MKNMIEVERFAEQKKIPVDKVISMIKSGFYVGRIKGEQWYVCQDELNGVGSNADEGDQYGSTIKVSGIITFVGWFVTSIGILTFLFFIAGLIEQGEGWLALLAGIPGLSISFLGILLVAVGHLLRIIIDIANNSRDILEALRNDEY